MVKIKDLDVLSRILYSASKFSLIKEAILVSIKLLEVGNEGLIDFLFVNHSHDSSVELEGLGA